MEGWREGGNSNNPPVVVAGLGPDGQPGILLNIAPATGSGSRFLMFNPSEDWIGDYTAAGVNAVGVSVDNRTGLNSSISLRAAFDGPGGWFVTETLAVVDSTAGDDFTSLIFDLNNLTFIPATGSGEVSETLGSVTNFEILRSAPGTLPVEGGGGRLVADQGEATFAFDDIRALAVIPEPSSALLSLLGLGVLLRRKRH